jgi:hypothetical protein
MRGQKDICLFCQHALKPPRSSAPTRRCLSSRPYEPYVLPRVIIDLDAADSKFVRRLEDLPKHERESQLRIRKTWPRRQDEPVRRQSYILTEDWDPEVVPLTTVYLKTHAVTSPDLLQYALLGEPSTQSTGAHYLRNIFKRRMLPPQEDASTKIQQLTVDFTTDAAQSLKAAGYTPNPIQEEKITQDLLSCWSFRRLERMLVMLSTTTEGCKFLATKGKVVVQAIRRIRKAGFGTFDETGYKAPEVKISMVVELLNNLTRNMTSRGVEIEDCICCAGLYYASKASLLPAVKMYLDIARRHGYRFDWKFGEAVRNLMFDYTKENIAPKRWAAWKDEASRREDVLKLITGWNFEEVSCSHFISTAENWKGTITPYSSYIVGLGEMGFSNALWDEWESRAASILRGKHNVRFKGQLFAMAFVLAKDPERALEILKSIPENAGHWWHDKIRIRRQVFDHYDFHGLGCTEKLEEMAGQGIPNDPTEALETYEKLLLVDFPKFISDTKLKLDWGSRGKDEGLLVMPIMGNDPIYFKPAGTRIREERK